MRLRFSLLLASALAFSPALSQETGKPTDPQIAHIAYTAGLIDIEAAKLAQSRSENKDVRAFAADMLRDHEAVNEKALALVKKARGYAGGQSDQPVPKEAGRREDVGPEGAERRSLRPGVRAERSRLSPAS